MDIRQWWTKVSEATQIWLLQNNGSPLPSQVSADIAAAGGPSTSQLSDDDVNWIDAVGNGESPD